MDKEFSNILDECLERLLGKGETIEQCLQSYPERAVELKPLLQTALAAKEAANVQPRAEFKTRARYQFRAALQEAASRRARPLFGWLPQWATVVAIVLGLLLIGSGTVAAAGYSMPDSPLYPIKLATENVQLTLTRSNLDKAELHAKLADRRVTEIVYMANKGDVEKIEILTNALDKRLIVLTSLVSAQEVAGTLAPVPAPTPLPAFAPSEEARIPAPAPKDARGGGQAVEVGKHAKLRMTVVQSAANNPTVLRAVLEKAPESAKPALRRAIAVSVAGYERALEALD